jgi:carbonic anhydrase
MPFMFSELLERNRAFAATDAKAHVPEIPFIPFRQVYLITCIDPRVEPAAVLGAGLGDAIVARNVGGRVTAATIQDLAWIVHLHASKTPDADWFEIAVMHHTDCGSALLADDELRAGYVQRGGYDDRQVRELAVLDPFATVREDVERIRTAPELRPGIEHIGVGGYAYDLATGVVTTVVEPRWFSE